MAETLNSLGIIAGNRSLPFMLARQAREMGVKRLVAVGFENETDPALEDFVDEMEWQKVGQLGKLSKAFTKRGVRQCVMVGQIAPSNLFDLRPDFRAMALLWRLKEKNAHTIFGGIADELAKDGVELISALPWLEPLMPKAGYHLGPKLDETAKSDVEFGHRIAGEISRLEIGQIVVVKEGTVLAVEGFEGTDQCLARGGKLAGKKGGAVAVKVAKQGHDMRFDIPCIGEHTLQTCVENGVRVLAFESGRTLVLDEDQVTEVCRRRKVTLTTIESA